ELLTGRKVPLLGAPVRTLRDARFATVRVGRDLTTFERAVLDHGARIEITTRLLRTSLRAPRRRSTFRFRGSRRTRGHNENSLLREERCAASSGSNSATSGKGSAPAL